MLKHLKRNKNVHDVSVTATQCIAGLSVSQGDYNCRKLKSNSNVEDSESVTGMYVYNIHTISK